jgi:hypothetical protein
MYKVYPWPWPDCPSIAKKGSGPSIGYAGLALKSCRKPMNRWFHLCPSVFPAKLPRIEVVSGDPSVSCPFLASRRSIRPGPTNKQNRYHSPGRRVLCAAKTRRELPLFLRLAGFPQQGAGREGFVLEKWQKSAPSKKVQVPVLASREPFCLGGGKDYESSINEFGENPHLLRSDGMLE